MAFADKSLDDLYVALARAVRERDAKGRRHPDYPLAEKLISSLKRAIADKKRSVQSQPVVPDQPE